MALAQSGIYVRERRFLLLLTIRETGSEMRFAGATCDRLIGLVRRVVSTIYVSRPDTDRTKPAVLYSTNS